MANISATTHTSKDFSEESTTLTVVTLNTWKGDGDYPQRLARMAAGLQQLEPDLVLLQEVLKTPDGALNTGAFLAKALGMELSFLPIRRKPRPISDQLLDSYSGLAVLSYIRPEHNSAIQLPQDNRDGERWAQCLSIYLGEQRVSVINTHLTHLSDAEQLRREQWSRILQHAAQSNAAITIIGGDFNCHPNSQSLANHQGRSRPVGAWQEAGAEPYPTSLNGCAQSNCVDHLYRLGDPTRWLRVDTALSAGNNQQDWASDHCAVVGQLKLTISSLHGRRRQ